MGHLNKARGGLLLIFYLLTTQLKIFSCSSSQVEPEVGKILFEDIPCPQQSPRLAPVMKKVHRISFNEVPQSAIISKPDILYFRSLDNSTDCDHFALFNDAEREIVKEFIRLGLRIHSSLGRSTIHLKYITSITIELLYRKTTKKDGYDEAHHIFNFLDSSDQIAGTVWDVLARGNRDTLLNYLITAMESNQLMRACLILKRFPSLIEELPIETLQRCVFIKHNVRSVFKYFIFPLNPEFFMINFLETYRSADNEKYPTYQSFLLNVLADLLIDLNISDETVQWAFDFLLDETKLEFAVVNVFVMARKRTLTICDEKLQSIIFEGDSDNLTSRLALLNLNIPSVVLELIVRKAIGIFIESSNIFYIIMSNKNVVNKLNPETIAKVVIFCIRYSRLNHLRSESLRVPIEAIYRLKLQRVVLFGVLVLERLDIEKLEVLINLKMSKTGLPIFSRKHLILVAAKSIENNRLDICKFLFSRYYIISHDQIIQPTGSKTLLAMAVEYGNMKFIEMAASYGVNWQKCKDAIHLARNNSEMRGLLLSLGAPDDDKLESEENVGYGGSPIEIIRAAAEPTFISPRSSGEAKSCDTPERKFVCNKPVISGTPLIKRPRTESVFDDYSVFLVNGYETDIIEIFCNELNLESLKHSRGTSEIVWELYAAKMFSALDTFLGSFVLAEEIDNLVMEAIFKKCDYIIKYFLKTFAISLDHKIGDRCVMAQLFRHKNPDIAFELMDLYHFDIRHSDSLAANPDGDIILSAAWSVKLVEKLIDRGASPNVNLYHAPSKSQISLLQWAQLKGGKTGLGLEKALTKVK